MIAGTTVSHAVSVGTKSDKSSQNGSVREFTNAILRHLPAESLKRLKLRAVELPAGLHLARSEQAVQNIYFIESGVGSMTYCFEGGAEVEVAMFGGESAIGISSFMGVRRSINSISMQIAGTGYVASLQDARAEFEKGCDFQRMALRYLQMQLSQAAVLSACNARHDLGQRLARWLLLRADQAATTELVFSQEFLAVVLGVERDTVAPVMGQLKRRGCVDYTRGRIHLLEPRALESQACECYRTIKHQLKNYLDGDTGFMV